jgi:hypothetical protein
LEAGATSGLPSPSEGGAEEEWSKIWIRAKNCQRRWCRKKERSKEWKKGEDVDRKITRQ